MQPLCCIILTALCSLLFLSPLASIQCHNKTQYHWPIKEPTLCCNMCPPGHRMASRADNTCEIECVPCQGSRYTDSDNVLMFCRICTSCVQSNMEYESQCNATHNAVCRCKAGYRCKDQSCTMCEIDTTTSTTTNMTPKSHQSRTPPTSTAASTFTATSTPLAPYKPIRDTVWFLVIIALLCVGIALALATKLKPFLRWIRSKHDYFLAEKEAPSPVDEEVSKPVQEVCGKCDQPIDV